MLPWPRISLGLRLFIIFFVLLGMTTYLVSKTVIQELKPTVRQATEETLVDMANLLAVLAAEDLANGTMQASRFAQLIAAYGLRNPQAQIWQVNKSAINHRIYITDHKGIVVADSWQQDLGKDYSQWNDVYLTLRGEYGARSTSLDPNDPLSSVMYVAAPIYDQGRIIGSVTVAKANRSVQPFIDSSKRHVAFWGLIMTLVILLVVALVSWRIHSALQRLESYAVKLGQGEKIAKPTFRISYEYASLSHALETLRKQLDGKHYVEEYIQTLTHELKSPLSAIKGASEILQTPLPPAKVAHFAQNVERESERMQALIEQLLALAKLEQLPQLEQYTTVDIGALINDVIFSSELKLNKKNSSCRLDAKHEFSMQADRFLMQQALFNLMDNALDFVWEGGEILWTLCVQDGSVKVSIFNQGPCIPDYALAKLTQRFYSLPRANGVKSTGLGLNFVEQIVKLHHGQLQISNVPKGVKVSFIFPST